MSKTKNKFSREVRERAVRLVLDNQGQHGSRWQAVLAVSSKIGCAPQTLKDRVKKAEVDGGMRPGVSGEMAETINGLLKAGVIHRRGPWHSFEAVEYATLEWVDWFNNRRLIEPIKNIPPAQAEPNFYAASEIEPMAVQRMSISLRQSRRVSWSLGTQK